MTNKAGKTSFFNGSVISPSLILGGSLLTRDVIVLCVWSYVKSVYIYFVRFQIASNTAWKTQRLKIRGIIQSSLRSQLRLKPSTSFFWAR